MFSNISSLLTSSLLQKYSFILVIESIFVMALDVFILLIKEMNFEFPPEIKMRPEFLWTVSIVGQGTWSGITGITVAILCNKLQQEKFREKLLPLGAISNGVLHIEAGLFSWSVVVALITFIAVLLSGYSALGIVAHDLAATQVERAMAILIVVEIVLNLALCLTVFSLIIFSFNALLPVYFSTVYRKVTEALCHRYSSDRWKQSPTCDFSRASFVGSSVQFGTIDTMSDLTIPTLIRKLAAKRTKDSPRSSFASDNRSDLINL